METDLFGEEVAGMSLADMASAIYKAYPKHRDRPQALTAIEQAITRCSKRTSTKGRAKAYEYLMRKAMAYAALVKPIRNKPSEWRLVPYPQKWFNRERYDLQAREWAENFRTQVPYALEQSSEIPRNPGHPDYLDKRYCNRVAEVVQKLLASGNGGRMKAWNLIVDCRAQGQPHLDRNLSEREEKAVIKWARENFGFVKPSREELMGGKAETFAERYPKLKRDLAAAMTADRKKPAQGTG